MNINEDLIQHFFQGKCNQAEATAVLRYLKENPDAAERYLGKSEWDQIAAITNEPLPRAQRKRLLANIKLATYKNPVLKKPTYQWAIAASLLLYMFISLQVYINYNEKPAALVKLNQQDSPWKQINNTSNKVISLVLKDGTKVKLFAHSQISFPQIFSPYKRDIKLSGKAFFDVAKDKKRPFTVISHTISTTALGTQFMVDAFKKNTLISVKLYEGHVVVKSIKMAHKKAFPSVHLYPNQELVYDKLTGLTNLRNFNEVPTNQNKNLGKESLAGGKNFNITFEHEPIENVFTAIEQAYQIHLRYQQAILKDHYFTGSFHIREDSLARVLHILSETNKLNIIKTKSGYMITKSADN